jgi:hypothetical protein
MFGTLLTKWTIRLALACYVAYLGGWLATSGRPDRRWPVVARWLWTLGCGLFLVHVACAFHFTHGWSHAAAFESTAAETEAFLGTRFGEGIYFRYVFLVLWVLDVVASWVLPATAGAHPRPLVAALRGAVHTYLFFIAFNGAIVFENGPTRWAGIGACVLLAALAARAAYNWRQRERGTRNAELGAGNAELETQSKHAAQNLQP